MNEPTWGRIGKLLVTVLCLGGIGVLLDWLERGLRRREEEGVREVPGPILWQGLEDSDASEE